MTELSFFIPLMGVFFVVVFFLARKFAKASFALLWGYEKNGTLNLSFFVCKFT